MLFLSFLSPVTNGFILVAGCPCACGDSFFPLSTSTKAQSSGQTATIIIAFINFNLYRLLSLQAALRV